MDADFAFGFMQAIDGEKDPRVLVQVFKLVPIVLREFLGFTRFSEDFFEVVSCYFPISFNPRANDPEGITKKELLDGLRTCMAATPEFAQHCIPLLLEKLSSSVTDTKLDALETLAMCSKAFGMAISPFTDDLWSSLRTEVHSTLLISSPLRRY